MSVQLEIKMNDIQLNRCINSKCTLLTEYLYEIKPYIYNNLRLQVKEKLISFFIIWQKTLKT